MVHARMIHIVSCASVILAAACQNSTPLVVSDGGVGDGVDDAVPLSLCPVPTIVDTPPLTANFQFENDSSKSLFLHVGCLGTEFGISSCAMGFAEVIEGTPPCSCSCSVASTGCPTCGACPQPAALEVVAGSQSVSIWQAVQSTEEQQSGRSCNRVSDLPGGRYRVAVRVFDNARDAERNVGGRVVTRDFDLAKKAQNVAVPIDIDDPACGPPRGESLRLCSTSPTRENGCALPQPLTFGWEGGFVSSIETIQIEVPHTLTAIRRFHLRADRADETCSAAFPICSRDARLVTTGDLVRALAHPSVQTAFETTLPVYGRDDRPVDGSLLVIRRQDGTSLGIGGACTPPDSLCSRSLKPGMADLAKLLARLRIQLFETPQCERFGG